MDNRFNIDFFEFSFLVTACIPPRPIARAMFWQDVIDRYYNVLTQDERNNLFEWVNREPSFQHSLENKNEDCLLFNARYDKTNQYKIKINFKNKESFKDAFLWQGKYHLGKATSINPEYIVETTKILF